MMRIGVELQGVPASPVTPCFYCHRRKTWTQNSFDFRLVEKRFMS
jgi:hypothetical protein